MPRVFIVHGWSRSPSKDWFPWLKEQLESKDFAVEVPFMPNTDAPSIDEWIPFLEEKVRNPDENTYLVGHSIGCQTILRYLEKIDSKIGGAVLVAGWMNLTEETFGEEGAEEIASPWIDTPIDFDKVKANCDKFLCIFSDNDPYVPISDSEIFKEKLGADIVILKEKGHFTGEDGVKEIPVVLEFFCGL